MVEVEVEAGDRVEVKVKVEARERGERLMEVT